MSFLTRFAPSPTGHLHIGHAFAAWSVEAYAAHLGAAMVLRIEDIDPTRCRPEFEESLLTDLHWLGLRYGGAVVRQSQRMAIYAQAIGRLHDLGLIYPCSCTRRQVRDASPGLGPDGPLYGGTCRDRGPENSPENSPEAGLEIGPGNSPASGPASGSAPDLPVAWRLNMAAAMARARGLSCDPTPWGDLILVRRETPTSYHLSVVCDDAAQGITHVMRGKDLEGITAVHRLLQHLLDLPTPTYAFHDLLKHDDGAKFSKSEGRAPTIAQMRAQGLRPQDLYLRLNRIPNLRGQIDAIKSGDFL